MNITDYSYEPGPPVTIVADTAPMRHMLTSTARAAGASIFRTMDVPTGLEHLQQGRPTGTLLIDIAAEVDPNVIALVDAARRHTARDLVPFILSTPLDGVDTFSEAGLDEHVTWLCQPALGDRVASLALELENSVPGFADVSTEMDPQRLRRLADEVSRIARTLASLSGPRPLDGHGAHRLADAEVGYRSEEVDLAPAPDMPAAEEVRRLLRVRRLRDSFFDPALFADPAWDMLLDLMAARLERAQVAVSSLCIAAAVPPTTALRWIKTMTDHGLFERCADPDDGRRIFIRLSDHAMQAMARYFAAAKRIGGAAG